jgi:hypothetical protein
MGDGRWEMGDGRWEMGDGRWEQKQSHVSGYKAQGLIARGKRGEGSNNGRKTQAASRRV